MIRCWWTASVGPGSQQGSVNQYVTIGNRVFVGTGTVVVKSIADDLTVVRNPARPIRR